MIGGIDVNRSSSYKSKVISFLVTTYYVIIFDIYLTLGCINNKYYGDISVFRYAINFTVPSVVPAITSYHDTPTVV